MSIANLPLGLAAVLACELPARGQIRPPAGEQMLHVVDVRRDPQRRITLATGTVHLVDRALDDPAGQVVDLDLVPQLNEQEVRLQRLRPAQPGALRGRPQHLAEVCVCIGRLHLPQRPTEPRPQPDRGDRHRSGSCRRPTQPRTGQARTRPAHRSRSPAVPPGWTAPDSRASPVRPPSSTHDSSSSPHRQNDRARR